jgi:hypothetical protein
MDNFPKLRVLQDDGYDDVSACTQALIEEIAEQDPDVRPEDFETCMKALDFQNALIELEMEIVGRITPAVRELAQRVVDFAADRTGDVE